MNLRTKQKIKFWFGIAIMVLVPVCMFSSCGEKKEEAKPEKSDTVKTVVKVDPLVKPPFTEINIKFQEITIDADSGRTFKAANKYGSSITVPRGAFVDSLKQAITGKVVLKYRELHTMNDILLAGVPLSYDAAGMLKRFNSGAMFELRAYQNNKAVYLDSGKVIQVRMATFEADRGYHAFYLNEDRIRNWVYIKDLEGEQNPEKKKIMQRASRNVDEFKIPFDGSYFAFNYMALLDVYLNDKTVEIKKNRNDLTLQGKIKEYGVTWSNIYCYQSVEFKGTKTLASLLLWKKQNKEPWPVWAASGKCDLQPADNGMFALELVSPNGKAKYKTLIQPFFPIKSLLAFSPSYWKNKYNLALRKAIEEEMRKQTIADVFQTIEAHSFGIYNIGKLQAEEDYVQVRLKPEFTGEKGNVEGNDIYYISENYRTVLKFSRAEWGNVTLLPDGDATLLTVLSGNKIAVSEVEDMRKLDYNALKKSPGSTVSIRFKTLGTSVVSIGEIAKTLGISEAPL